jgi:hypothetical protein
MKATPVEIDKYLKTIEAVPRTLAAATKGIPQARLHSKSEKNAWSVNEILAHLRACADLWTHSIYAMLAAREPALPDINERKWVKVTGYAEVPFKESFQAYILQRENLLRILKALPFDAWQRPAVILGRKHTVFTQVRRLAKHESGHLEQIESLLK